jgi:hypothetical protein
MIFVSDVILGDKYENGAWLYFVKYKGLSYRYNKWLSEEDFNT